ncbi:TonB C-terminal domain-containing protein [Sulfurimonas sp.]|uniref:energy transducer TonB family protein n=1 Tax=Sulfurimonas sp. TaxID=2022749 RepID=UPI0019EEE7EB|nr:TonB C-terminal domain-containing protein [Sulfurimonas sp.]MBE0514339.1 energy transducer TonB [Sulfurimonas sp.]
MNRSYFALFVALLIHFVLLLLFWLLGAITPEIKKEQKPQENKIKVSLKEMPKISKDAGDKKEAIKKPTPIAPPMPKGSQLKEMVTPLNKKPPIKYEPKKIQEAKRAESAEKKEQVKPTQTKRDETIQKPKIEPIPPSKPYIPMTPSTEEKKEQKPKEAYSWLYEDKSNEDTKEKEAKQSSGSSIGSSSLKELYGDMFGKLTPGQQKYLIDNQEIMRRITQEVLNRVAQVNLTRDMNVNRTNVVEFYLHPNGDISDFKFLQKSGYYVLDETTKETIEYAYSKYPRPEEKILVRYNVYYNLAR